MVIVSFSILDVSHSPDCVNVVLITYVKKVIHTILRFDTDLGEIELWLQTCRFNTFFNVLLRIVTFQKLIGLYEKCLSFISV